MFKMSNKTYDFLKFVALLIAPIIVFVSTVLNIWGIPHAEPIVATLAAFDVLVGAIVKIASDHYYGDGDESDS